MTKYIIRRFLGLIPTLFVIITLSFFIIRIAPGGPFSEERALPKQVLENIEKAYHLDDPLLVQYARYVFDILRGDLGPSFRYKDFDVNYYIRISLPNSMVLGLISLVLAVLLGSPQASSRRHARIAPSIIFPCPWRSSVFRFPCLWSALCSCIFLR